MVAKLYVSVNTIVNYNLHGTQLSITYQINTQRVGVLSLAVGQYDIEHVCYDQKWFLTRFGKLTLKITNIIAIMLNNYSKPEFKKFTSKI